MKLKKFKPTSPGVRHRLSLYKNLLGKNSHLSKSLVLPLQRAFGRSTSNGRITSWHRGGGAKRKFRVFKGKNFFGGFIVISIFYDPNRSSYVALVFDIVSKTFEFNVSPSRVSPGSCFIYADNLDERNLGSRASLKSIPPGSIIHNVGVKDSRLGLFGRAAGTSCRIIQKRDGIVKLKLPSGKLVDVSSNFFATLGSVGNSEHRFVVPGKAGYSRLRGRRPIVRGIAMNPVDHPHGGRTNGGRPSVTPWGKPTKGKPTVKNKN